MTARIFISYRTSDGVDKATALARGLNEVFGEAQVFLDKEDLPAGRPWREAVGATLDHKPVLLLVVTPHTFLAERIADPNDPVRREICAALDCGAHVIPLLADGVERLPDSQTLPEPLRSLGERTWRRLRAYDWREDLERLTQDLQQLGIARLERQGGRRFTDRRRALELGFAFAGGAAMALSVGAWWRTRSAADADPQHAFAGAWTLRAAPPASEVGSRLDRVRLHLAQTGEEIQLYSEPIDITRDPAWAAFAAQWRERFGSALDRVVWRGSGKAHLEQGSPWSIDVGLRVETPAGGKPIETGSLKVEAHADRRQLTGRLWMASEQAERAVEMTRGHD